MHSSVAVPATAVQLPVIEEHIACADPPGCDTIEPWHCSLDLTIIQLSNLNRAKCKDSGWSLVAKIFLLGAERFAETSKIQITSLVQNLDLRLSLAVTVSSCQDIDNVVYYPLLINFYESLSVTAKDKKRPPEEKLELLGQVTVDALPLLRGKDLIQGTWIIYPVAAQTAADAAAEPSRCEMSLTCSNGLVPAALCEQFNVITVNVHGGYGFPEQWLPNAAAKTSSTGFTLATALPRTGEQERILVAANKTLIAKGNVVLLPLKRWPAHPAIISDAIFRGERVSPKNYLKEQGDLCEPAHWPERHETERNQPCLPINTEFRCVLSNDAEDVFRSRATLSRILPVEVFEVTHLETKHTGVKKKGNVEGTVNVSDEPIMTRHGVAFVDLKPLLYPGATSITGAYVIKPYESSPLADKTKHTSLGSEILRGSPSVATKSVAEKLEGSRLSVSKKPLEHGPSHSDHHGSKNPPEPPGALRPESDAQLYETCKSFIYLEVTLDKPLIEKKVHTEIIDRLKEIIVPIVSIPVKHTRPGEQAQTVLRQQMEAMYDHFAELFFEQKKRISDGGKDSQEIGTGQACAARSGADRIRQRMEHRLTDTGNFHALKEQLKLNTARLVREKFSIRQPFTNSKDYDQFLSDLYAELTLHVQMTFIASERRCREIPSDVKPSPSSQTLRMLAMEAELDRDFINAERHLSQRTELFPKAVDCWRDLGGFYLRRSRYHDADDTFRQMLLDDFTDFNGLLLKGYVQLELGDYEKAGTFFEAVTLMYPGSALGWCALGIFNEIQPLEEAGMRAVATERAYIEAKRACGMDESHAKKYDLFLAAIAQAGIAEAAAAAAIIAPEQTTKNQQHVPAANPAPSRLKSGSKIIQKKDPKGSAQNQADIDKQRGEAPRMDVTFHNLSVVLPAKPRHERPIENIFWCAISGFASLGMHRMTNVCVNHLLASQCDMLDPVFWRSMVLSYIEQGRLQDAETFLNGLIKRDVETADMFANFGHIKYLQGDFQKAAIAYRRALHLTTEVSDPFILYFRYGRLSELCQHNKKAKEMFYRAAKLHSTCRAWLGCGRACYNLLEYDLAESALQEANYEDNRNPQVWAQLAMLNIKLNRLEIADRCYRAANVFGIAAYPQLLTEVEASRKMQPAQEKA